MERQSNSQRVAEALRCAFETHGEDDELQAYCSIGTVDEFRTLKDAEQARREGCRRCWNGECMMSGVDYSCETTCDKCRYSLRDKHFCPDCGRDLKGEQK